MKITEHLAKASGTLFSFEVLPPQKGKTIEDLLKVIEPLIEFKPPFIDVTYHREEIIYKRRPDGLIEEIPLRKRPGTVGICAAIKGRFNVDTVPHLICHGFTPEETEDALFTLHYLGIDNVMLLQGDNGKGKSPSDKRSHKYASDLVKQVANMNKGRFLHEETENELKTDFCIGVAGYPEKHFEAPNLNTDLKWLKYKIDCGAHYIVTQMFFDNKKYFEFVDKCKALDINVPIIPGIKPLTAKSQVNMLPRIFHIDIPDELVNEIEKCKDDKQAKQVGIEWAITQSKELKKKNVPCLHYYTMSRNEATIEIAKAVF
ncbi:MAG: methylenetetrahydrofolate reductase [NAD(P)H] [Chitinophagales bacterium]|nr:methylenetetrahydrofolate reductase [NAD(P)H] [Chitinophagales bacterium]MDW8274569.1 methylenetetrahydrofolate reductase [NAD(P)H] [Chitinophagales bacterium]